MSSNIPRVGISLSIQGESPQNVLDLAREADEAGLYALGAGDASSDTFVMQWLRSAGFEEEAAASEAAMADGNSTGVAAAISDRLVDSTTLIGTPEQCRERIAQYAGLVDWIVIHPQPGSSPADAAHEVRLLIRAFGDK